MSNKDEPKHDRKQSPISARKVKKLLVLSDYLSKQESKKIFKSVCKHIYMCLSFFFIAKEVGGVCAVSRQLFSYSFDFCLFGLGYCHHICINCRFPAQFIYIQKPG